MTVPYLPPAMSDVIVDLSHYDMVNPDFITVAESGIAAVILKATQGTGFVDPTFLSRAAEAKDAGLLVGAYHFLNGDSPAMQASHFLTVATEGGVSWLALDFEPYPVSQASVMQAATAAASIQAATGKWPALYTIRSMLMGPNKPLSKCPLWLAEYGTRPICPPGWSKWRLWQYTDRGSVEGIGNCDRSRFAGSIDQLKTWWNNPQP